MVFVFPPYYTLHQSQGTTIGFRPQQWYASEDRQEKIIKSGLNFREAT
jgi:hypothetical protein